MGEQRRVIDDGAIAEPVVSSLPSESAPETAGRSQEAPPATPGEHQGTSATPTDTAHPGRDDAQNLPTAARGAVAALHTGMEFVGTTGETPASDRSGPAAEAAEPTPTAGSQPGSVPALVTLTAPTSVGQTSVGQAPPAASPPDVPVQQVPAGESQSSAPRSGPAAAPPSVPGPAVAEGDQKTSGTGADANPGGRHEESGTRHPALGRAMQVQAAVTVENTTGLTPPGGMTTAAPVTVVAGTDVQAPPPVPAGLEVDDAQATGRVVRGLTSMLAQRGGAMTMRLEPPGLGQLRVEMTIARGTVSVQFQPATAEAQALLDRSLATLRTALESQGLTVERLTVHAAPPAPSARETAHDQSQTQQHNASRHHADAGDGRSRGRGDDESGHGRPNHGFTASFADAFESSAADSPESQEVLPLRS